MTHPVLLLALASLIGLVGSAPFEQGATESSTIVSSRLASLIMALVEAEPVPAALLIADYIDESRRLHEPVHWSVLAPIIAGQAGLASPDHGRADLVRALLESAEIPGTAAPDVHARVLLAAVAVDELRCVLHSRRILPLFRLTALITRGRAVVPAPVLDRLGPLLVRLARRSQPAVLRWSPLEPYPEPALVALLNHHRTSGWAPDVFANERFAQFVAVAVARSFDSQADRAAFLWRWATEAGTRAAAYSGRAWLSPRVVLAGLADADAVTSVLVDVLLLMQIDWDVADTAFVADLADIVDAHDALPQVMRRIATLDFDQVRRQYAPYADDCEFRLAHVAFALLQRCAIRVLNHPSAAPLLVALVGNCRVGQHATPATVDVVLAIVKRLERPFRSAFVDLVVGKVTLDPFDLALIDDLTTTM